MNWSNVLINVLLFIYVINACFMGLVIMMQRSKQEGLGAAFGGSITEGIWGAQTSSVLVKTTVWCAIIFFGLSIVLAKLYSTRNAHAQEASAAQLELSKPLPAPATPPTTNNVTPTGAPEGSVPATTAPPAPSAAISNAAPVTTTPVKVPATTTPAPAKSNK